MTTKKNSSKASSDKTNGSYAIVEASGKQFWLETNRYYDLDRIKADVDQVISIEKVLLLNNETGTVIGSPYVNGASVKLKVLEHRRGKKLIVYKMRPKKKTRRKNGHRQELTRVLVEAITTGTKSKSSTKSTSKKTATESKAKSSSETTSKKTTPKVIDNKKKPETSKVSKSSQKTSSNS